MLVMMRMIEGKTVKLPFNSDIEGIIDAIRKESPDTHIPGLAIAQAFIMGFLSFSEAA